MGLRDWLRRLIRWPAGGGTAPGPSTTASAPQPSMRPTRRPKKPAKGAAAVGTPSRSRALATRSPDGGQLLQFPGHSATTETDIVIGFDFGTSCSKVALQSPYKLGGRTMIVDFGQFGYRSCPCLLPATLFVDGLGYATLDAGCEGARPERHLKVGVLHGHSTRRRQPEPVSTDMALAAAYVGLALREVRHWFLTNEAENYGTDAIRWSLNLGIPSAGYDDTSVRGRFERIARAGWRLSLSPTPLAIENAAEAFSQSDDIASLKGAIEVVPEVAAQVVGYAKSRHRRDGLHLLLDVGASTIDLCAFVLHAHDGDDNYGLLTADVQPLGLLELHRRRIDAAAGRSPFDRIPADLIAPLPDWEDGDRAGLHGRALRHCDDRFVEECRRVLFRTLFDVRRRRDPNSPHWRSGLPLFVCGGGADSRVVRQFIQRANEVARQVWADYVSLQRMSLPLPPSVAADEGRSAHFGRLAVCFGLSFPAINVGRIERPSEIDDITDDRASSEWRTRFVDKDQV